MKITVNENRDIILKEVFNGVGLESQAGEEFGICMRDSGFEFNYGGDWYEAKGGKVTKMVAKKNGEDVLTSNKPPSKINKPK